jgi:hypothetical protein
MLAVIDSRVVDARGQPETGEVGGKEGDNLCDVSA